MNGVSSLVTIEPKPPPDAPPTSRARRTRSGVTNMPRMLEIVAEQTAAATFPFAMETKVTED